MDYDDEALWKKTRSDSQRHTCMHPNDHIEGPGGNAQSFGCRLLQTRFTVHNKDIPKRNKRDNGVKWMNT